MRRADRLFQIVEILRRSRRSVVTAAQLAERLAVSERTIYRDLADLSSSGVPIRGEAGVGYTLERGFHVPPLMFDADEIEALVLGARMVASHSDPELAAAASSALGKIEAVLSPQLQLRLAGSRLFAPNFHLEPKNDGFLATLRRAVETRQLVRFSYQRKDRADSERTVRPLCLAYAPPHWMLAAWCELRGEFRSFRLDRMRDLEVSAATFIDEPGKTLADFIRHVESERG